MYLCTANVYTIIASCRHFVRGTLDTINYSIEIVRQIVEPAETAKINRIERIQNDFCWAKSQMWRTYNSSSLRRNINCIRSSCTCFPGSDCLSRKRSLLSCVDLLMFSSDAFPFFYSTHKLRFFIRLRT